MTELTTEYQDLEDIRIAYCQSGSGENLILLHGNSESKRILRHFQLEHFADFHTWALDSRGHGESVSNDTKLTIEQLSQDVISFCHAQGISNAYVIGYSDGGNIALWLAKKAPELFPRIIAISPNTLVSATMPKDLRLFKRMYTWFKFLTAIGINMKKYILRFDLMLKDIGLYEEDLQSIRTQVKIIYAEHDMIKEEHFKDIARWIPNAELEKIPGCTHMNIIHNPQAIAVMREWLLESQRGKA
jgi:pimeloyl-ACP methyl ester carboxylesterase